MSIFGTELIILAVVLFVLFLLMAKFPTGRFKLVEYNGCYLAKMEYYQCFVKGYDAYGTLQDNYDCLKYTGTQWNVRTFYYKDKLMLELKNLKCINPEFLLKRDIKQGE